MSRPKKTPSPPSPQSTKTTGTTPKPPSEAVKWLAGIAAAIIAALIIFYLEKNPRPIMEVNLSYGDKPDWTLSGGFRTTPPPVTLVQGWSLRPVRIFHVQIRNEGDVPLLDCQPFSTSIPIENGVKAHESLPFRATPANIGSGEQKEWDGMQMRFYSDANKYEVHVLAFCSYYDLFHIKRRVEYEESGIMDYRRPTLQSLPLGIDQIIHDKSLADDLKSKVAKAEASDFDDQIKILTDLKVQLQGMGSPVRDTLGEDVGIIISDAQKHHFDDSSAH